MSNLSHKPLKKRFIIQLIQPSHYDDDGYVIQWLLSWPSNTLPTLNGLIMDASRRHVLGEDIEIETHLWHDHIEGVRIDKVIEEIRNSSGGGVVFMAGVQTCQLPRTLDLASALREEGIQVVMGGSHVTGVLAIFGEPHSGLKQAMEMGISLFAGEAEDRLDGLLKDAYKSSLQPIYTYDTYPPLEGQPIPFFPPDYLRMNESVFEVGRGCPFKCEFCCIINIFGNSVRSRSAADVEEIVRSNRTSSISFFFITDDNFSRNKKWEEIFDRLIELKEKEEIAIAFMMQVDINASKIPRFVEKAAQAGCVRVFIGVESINSDTIDFYNKSQNKTTKYQTLIQKWRDQGIFVVGSFIIGAPEEDEEQIMKDIHRTIDELPIDFFAFQILILLPGSVLHRKEIEKGTWISPDLNSYDTAHMTYRHPQISTEAMTQLYQKVWDTVYSPSNVKKILQRWVDEKRNPTEVMLYIVGAYGLFKFEKVHPSSGGMFRRKNRKTRRPGYPIKSPFIFYPCRIAEIINAYFFWGIYIFRIGVIRYFCLKK